MKNTDWIIIPDVHGRRFWRKAVQGHEDERIVFLGDYLDPYQREEITPGDSYRELRDIIAFKKAHPDNVVLLLGNHDLGYLDQSVCSCRRDIFGYDRNRRLLESNLDLFDLVHETDIDGTKVLFSHAGIRQEWVRYNDWLFCGGDFDPLVLNSMLHEPSLRDDLMLALSQVSLYRGGYDPVGSPVWADANELMDSGDFLPGYLHVFGHTAHKGGPVLIRTEQGDGWCMDCADAFRMDRTGQMRYLDYEENNSQI